MPIRSVEAEWPQTLSPKGRWGYRMAMLALSTLFVAGLAFRNRGISLSEFGATLAVGTSLAAIGFLLSVIALTDLWRHGGRGTRLAFTGAGLGALGFSPAVVSLVLSALLPPINDITTSFESPPPFTAVAEQRRAVGAAVEYPGPSVATAQFKAYPEIVPLSVPHSPKAVYDAARALAEDYGWEVIGDPVEGTGASNQDEREQRPVWYLTAVSHTMFLNFKDDVAIRITQARQGGAQVDMRSASRLGEHDFGTNARRITDFLAALEERLNNPQPQR